MCVNALYRAHFISTTIKLDTQKTSADRCQCPISGALHFYAQLYSKVCQDGYVCQCPISGALHFYGFALADSMFNGDVSMPYIGRTSFLRTEAIRTQCMKLFTVSMPYIGRTSFLRGVVVPQSALIRVVSMPYIGRTSFLQEF